MSFEERIYAFRDIKDMEPIRGAKTPNKGLREERFNLVVAFWTTCRERFRMNDANIIRARWGNKDFNYLYCYMEQNSNLPLFLFSFDWYTENVFPILVIHKFWNTYGNKLVINNRKELTNIMYDFIGFINSEFGLPIYKFSGLKRKATSLQSQLVW